jgi:hypothetical protein
MGYPRQSTLVSAPLRATVAVTCAGCGFCVDAACYATAGVEVAHCVQCAFGDNAAPVSRRHARRRPGDGLGSHESATPNREAGLRSITSICLSCGHKGL